MRTGERTSRVKNGWLEQDFQQWDECAAPQQQQTAHQHPCQVIIRNRNAKTPWESVVKAVVGNPVHVDVVLAKQGSPVAKFCFSSYMSHKFEMVMMDHAMIHDTSMVNLAIGVSDQELERCTKFLTALEGKAAYSYFDAFVLMPMAPKVDLSPA